MGIRDWFQKRSARPPILSNVRSPSTEYPTPLSAIEALIDADSRANEDGSWLTFRAGADPNDQAIEVSGGQINFCLRDVDLPSVLRTTGLADLAAQVQPGGRKNTDQTCWTLASPTPASLARIIDAVFSNTFGLGDSYPLMGERNC